MLGNGGSHAGEGSSPTGRRWCGAFQVLRDVSGTTNAVSCRQNRGSGWAWGSTHGRCRGRRWRGRCGDGSNHGAGQRISTAPSPLNGGRVRGLPIMSWDGSRRSSDIRRWRLLGTLSAVAGKGGFAGHRRVARSPHSPPSSGPPLVRSAGLSSRSAGWWGAAAAPSAHTNVRLRRAHRVVQHTRRREILVQIVRVAINPRARLQRWTKAPVVLRSMPCTMIVPAWAARGEHASQ